MKKSINIILIIAILSGVKPANAQLHYADPHLVSFGFAAASIGVNATTKLQIFVSNEAISTDSLPIGGITLKVSLPVTFTYGGNPTGIAAVGGPYGNHFTWSYNSVTHTYTGVLAAAIQAGDGGLVEIEVVGLASTNGAAVLSTVNMTVSPLLVTGDDQNNNNLLPTGLIVTAPLPVKLVYFKGTYANGQTKINWQTSDELNSKNFVVEKSVNSGASWSSIGSVASHGNTGTTQNYFLNDNNVAPGKNLYRLKMIDIDGRFEYSNILLINAGSKAVTVYPNPVKDKAGVTGLTKGSRIKLLNLSGQLLFTSPVINTTTYEVDLAKYQKGVYLLQIEQENQSVQSVKLVRE